MQLSRIIFVKNQARKWIISINAPDVFYLK